MSKKLRKALLAIVMIAMVCTQSLTHVRAADDSSLPVDEITEESQTVEKGVDEGLVESRQQVTYANDSTVSFNNALEIRGSKKVYPGASLELYNHLVVSGNGVLFEEGSYMLIKAPKRYAEQFEESKVDKGSSVFKSLEIYEDSEYYILKIIYKDIKGGHSEGRSISTKLNPNQAANGTQVTFKQEYYSNDNVLRHATENSVELMTSFGNYAENFMGYQDYTDIVTADKKIPEGTVKYVGTGAWNGGPNPDTRDRRIYARLRDGNLPEEKYSSGWTKDSNGRFYKDVKYNDLPRGVGFNVDFSGIDLSGYPSGNPYRFSVEFEIHLLDHGQESNEFQPVTAYASGGMSLKNDIPHNNLWIASTDFNVFTGNKNYDNIGLDNDPYKPGEKAIQTASYARLNDSDIRFRALHQPLSNVSFDNDPELSETLKSVTVTSSTMEVPSFGVIEDIRLDYISNPTGYTEVEPTEADKTLIRNKLAGTEIYGYTRDGKKVSLGKIDDVNFVRGSYELYTNKGFNKISEPGIYKYIEFIYPNNGITFDSETSKTALLNGIHTEIGMTASKESLDFMKDKLSQLRLLRLLRETKVHLSVI